MVIGASSRAATGAGVDDLALGDRRADDEPVVVDGERDERRLEPAGAHGVAELGRVLADDADRHVRVATGERPPRGPGGAGGARR